MAKVMDNNVNVNDVSRISAGTVIKGEINSPNDIRIDGSFEGKIISKGRVVVGDKAIMGKDDRKPLCQGHSRPQRGMRSQW